jgi:predicted O-methyltransferase YrrM
VTDSTPLSSQRELEEALDGVEGWFAPQEAWVLHETIRELFPERQITVVEFGSYKGRSTITAGRALLARARGGTLYAMDPQDDDSFEQLRTNLTSAGVESVVRLIRATSREGRKQLGPEPIDLIFIDGSHKYEDVRDDLGDSLPLLRPGGIVALNDPYWWGGNGGVNRAIRERLALGGPLRSPRFAHNTLFFTYSPNAKWGRADGLELLRVRASLLVGHLWGPLLFAIGAAPILSRRAKRRLAGAVNYTFRRFLPPATKSAVVADSPLDARSR